MTCYLSLYSVLLLWDEIIDNYVYENIPLGILTCSKSERMTERKCCLTINATQTYGKYYLSISLLLYTVIFGYFVLI